MPPSKTEQILEALKAVLQTVPAAEVERNTALPEKIPTGSTKAANVGWMSLTSSRSRSRLIWTLAHCCRTFYRPTSLYLLRLQIADPGAPSHRVNR
jgi:hypothetical protein